MAAIRKFKITEALRDRIVAGGMSHDPRPSPHRPDDYDVIQVGEIVGRLHVEW